MLNTLRKKIELNLVCKLLKKLLKEYSNEKMHSSVIQVMEDTKSTKKKIQIAMRYDLMMCLTDEKYVKHFDGKKINEIASEFYANLYEDKSSTEDLETKDMEEPLPKFVESEVERVISTLKDGKVAGYHGINHQQTHQIWGGGTMIKILTKLFNEILETNNKIPQTGKYRK